MAAEAGWSLVSHVHGVETYWVLKDTTGLPVARGRLETVALNPLFTGTPTESRS